MEIDLKKYNNISALNELKNDLIKRIDNRIDEIKVESESKKLKDSSFGYIKNSFENLSESLFETKKGRQIIGDYVNKIKNSNNLYIMHSIYENLRKSGTNSDCDYIIDSIINAKKNLTPTINEDISSLSNILCKAYKLVGKSAKDLLPSVNEKLDNAINYIVNHEQSIENASEYGQAIKILKEEISSNKGENLLLSQKSELSEDIESLINEFNAKYSNSLTSEDKKIINKIASASNKIDLFIESKNNCCTVLIEAKNELESKGDKKAALRLDEILQKIVSKHFSEESLLTDIINLNEIERIFKKQNK